MSEHAFLSLSLFLNFFFHICITQVAHSEHPSSSPFLFPAVKTQRMPLFCGGKSNCLSAWLCALDIWSFPSLSWSSSLLMMLLTVVSANVHNTFLVDHDTVWWSLVKMFNKIGSWESHGFIGSLPCYFSFWFLLRDLPLGFNSDLTESITVLSLDAWCFGLDSFVVTVRTWVIPTFPDWLYRTSKRYLTCH